MMREIQTYCNMNTTLINVENTELNQVYAGMHSDGNWYR